MSQNKVILIGSNNYNGLGLVRSFGRHNIKTYGIIVGRDAKGDYLTRSKYWEKFWHVDDAEDAIPCLLREFRDEGEKPVVISYIDKVTQLLDLSYETLSEKFILPSFNQKSGEIEKLASKKAQEIFAGSIGYEMLKTQIISLTPEIAKIDDSDFPVIMKPASGGEGDKHDITICNQQDEYTDALNTFREKGYERILMQPYLTSRTEYVLLGAICPEAHFSSFTILRNIRQWPTSFGIGCFSEYVTEENDPEVFYFAEKLFSTLMDLGYDSPIDIELFKDDRGHIYINEFNWRVSGRNFTAIDTGVYSVVWWYLVKTEQDIGSKPLVNTKSGYTMKETEDIKNAIFKKIGFKQWFHDYRKTHSFGVFDKRDIKPMVFQYWKLVKSFILR